MKLHERIGFTWIGHGTWSVRTVAGRHLLMDAYVASNPVAPERVKDLGDVDVVILTHGHIDHVADVVGIARDKAPTVLCTMELGKWLVRQGVAEDTVIGFNKGGTVEAHGLTFTMVHAEHSSSTPDGAYAGAPVGYVITFEDGFRIYFSGDTDVFGDMALIRELEHPDAAFLPIGDFYTMGPRRAAKAVELLGVKQVVAMHYGTRSVHVGRPEHLAALVPPDVTVIHTTPGETI
ncbi:metal-dependent hydrolase [Amycolatopsis samaneae]|uniref:Metal-dependent hydrolase n=1 Tax=Amycolatopsis samaneae TaxID=664691 RepID=A0ABW5GFL3_9PSEU